MLFQKKEDFMNQCIYLKKTEPNATFKKREHIIPASIGGCRKLDKGWVSDEINEKFSNIELEFARNSIISIPRAFEGPGKRGSFSVGKSTKSAVSVMVENSSNQIKLGYLSKGKPYSISQLIVENNKVNIILNKSDNYNDELNKFLNLLKRFDGNYIHIKDKDIREDLFILGFYDDKWYVLSKTKENKVDITSIINKVVNNNKILELNPVCNKKQITATLKTSFNQINFYRIFSKIAFNFLAFSKGIEFVLDSKFDLIRNWIVNSGENNYAYLIECTNKKIPLPEKAHSIIIFKIEKKLISRVTLYGNFEVEIILSNDFNEDFIMDAYICDWKNKKEYRLNEYFEILI